jgi:hypothetical protein
MPPMTEPSVRKRRSVAWIVTATVVALLAAGIGLGVALLSEYSQTEDADVASATQVFQDARARFAGQVPLLELRGAEPPVFHREPISTRPIAALHALVYSGRDESLRRWNVPVSVLRVITVGGHIRLIDFGMPGDNRARLTLEDLEKRGPGLVVDAFGGAIAPLAASDALVGSKASDSLLLMWTE